MVRAVTITAIQKYGATPRCWIPLPWIPLSAPYISKWLYFAHRVVYYLGWKVLGIEDSMQGLIDLNYRSPNGPPLFASSFNFVIVASILFSSSSERILYIVIIP